MWNMIFHLQHENALLKAKYNDLQNIVGEILETVKIYAKLRIDNDNEMKSKVRCKYQNKGFCREGSSCVYSHREQNCPEFCSSGSCSQDPVCPYRHPNKCKFWIRGKCWRGATCVYLHRNEDLGSVEDNDGFEKNYDVENYDYDVENYDNDDNLEKDSELGRS